jgi:dihydrofolate reductase
MRLTLTTFLSLDGVMQSPGGPTEDPGNGFEQGGWLVPYADETMGEYVGEWFGNADAFLLGRRTYDIFYAYWPNHESDLNTKAKYVVSTTLEKAEWHNSFVIGHDVENEIAKLKEVPGNELQIHGSGALARSLMAHGLIDEYRLFVYPVVLGNGQRLFDQGGSPTAFDLVESKTTSTGVTVQVYRPAGAPTYGTFLDEPEPVSE